MIWMRLPDLRYSHKYFIKKKSPRTYATNDVQRHGHHAGTDQPGVSLARKPF